MIVATFGMIESFLDPETSFLWLYFLLKIVFLIFCYHTEYRGTCARAYSHAWERRVEGCGPCHETDV
jgi:hypothetical protein